MTGSQHTREVTNQIVDFVPGVGDIVGMDEMAAAIRRGDYDDAAVEAVAAGFGIVPVVGDAGSKVIKIMYDNPGGSWLARKKQSAEDRMKMPVSEVPWSVKHGITGTVTARTPEPVKIKREFLDNIPGANREESFRDSGEKLRMLEQEHIRHPSQFNTEEHPIMIGINHLGEPYIMEGNHRLAYAKKHGIEDIDATITWFNGGEEVRSSMFHPNEFKVSTPLKPSRKFSKPSWEGLVARVQNSGYSLEEAEEIVDTAFRNTKSLKGAESEIDMWLE